MTVPLEIAKPDSKLAFIFEIEVGQRIDTASWSSEGSSTYSTLACLTAPAEVHEASNTTFVTTDDQSVGSVATCKITAGSYYYDPAAAKLYLHAIAGNNPSDTTIAVMAFYWRRFCDQQYPPPYTIVDIGGFEIEPRLLKDSIPDITLELTMFYEGTQRQTWDTITIANGDGAYDLDIVNFIWESRLCYLKVVVPGEAYSAAVNCVRARTGKVTWADDVLSVDVEDQMLNTD